VARRTDGPSAGAARSAAAGIRLSDRVTIVGRSNSGKSTLLRQLIRRDAWPRAILIDYKGSNALPDWHHTRGLAEFRRDFPKVPRIIAQRAPFENEVAWFDGICRIAFAFGDVAVGIDELPADLTVGAARSPGLEELYKLGRERRAMPIACIQRSKNVPLVMFSEASHLFVFQLLLNEDRERIRQVIGDFPLPRSEHGFVYARPGLGEAVECAPLAL
jgi:hypothetical protein